MTVEKSISESKAQCNRLFNDQGLSLSGDKDKWSKREYVNCVVDLTNARQNQSTVNTLKGVAITHWILMAVGVIVNFVKGL